MVVRLRLSPFGRAVRLTKSGKPSTQMKSFLSIPGEYEEASPCEAFALVQNLGGRGLPLGAS